MSVCGEAKYPVGDIPHGMIKHVPNGQLVVAHLFHIMTLPSSHMPFEAMKTHQYVLIVQKNMLRHEASFRRWYKNRKCKRERGCYLMRIGGA
jgi:hypothetical protein